MRPSDIDLSAIDDELSARCQVCESSCRPGVQLLVQGTPAPYMYLLTAGFVKLSFVGTHGREYISGVRSAKALVGVESTVLGTPSLITATALAHCRIRRFPADRVRQALRSNSILAIHIINSLARESLDQTTARIEAAYGNARQRLVSVLKRMSNYLEAALSAEGPLEELPLKQHEIAKLIAVTPEHLSRLLRDMQREGVLREGGRRVLIGL
jgi:CRP/FNR family transcriptional regulator, cyclic AMP receptor protein